VLARPPFAELHSAPPAPSLRDLVLQPWSQNFDPSSPLSQPVSTVKIVPRWVGSCAAGTTAPRNRDRERATQPSKFPPRISRKPPAARGFGRSESAGCGLAAPKAKTKSFNTEHTEKRGEIQSILCSVISVDFLCVLCVSDFFPGWRITSNTFGQSQSNRQQLPRRISCSAACGGGCGPPSVRP
jgi:hypothetical protein